MAKLERISFTIDEDLCRRLEALIEEAGYQNRSEFIRDLVRARLVAKEWEEGEEAVGTITLVYDHGRTHLSNKLTDLQHEHHHAVLATTHVHLDHHLCAEMIMAKGKPAIIQALADSLGQQKGVLHATLSMSSTGAHLQ